MKAKTKIGMGLKTKKKKKYKRILLTAKRGDVLPVSTADRGHLSVAWWVLPRQHGNKAAQHQLEELQRHNRAMAAAFLAFYKRGQGITYRKKNNNEMLKGE